MNYEEMNKSFIKIEAYLEMYDIVEEEDVDEESLKRMGIIIVDEVNRLNWFDIRRNLAIAMKTLQEASKEKE